MEKITLHRVLPRVFEGSEHEPPVCNSQVWLRDIEFRRGHTYLIEAESGTGKSSLCSFIYGTRTDYLGQILFDDNDIEQFNIERWCALRRSSLAYLPQEMELFPELSVLDNIELKNALTATKSHDEIMEMLRCVGVAEKATQLAGKLSVGQQQRVAIVRALCQPFDFLLIDEPVSHLDATSNAAVASLIHTEAMQRGAGIIATSVGNKIALPDFTLLKL